MSRPMFPDAGNLAPGPCTGLTARWCPIHGNHLAAALDALVPGWRELDLYELGRDVAQQAGA